ncbi:MAG: NAD(P)/FAD-dependent oxidoreductase [Thiohalospira sp.]
MGGNGQAFDVVVIGAGAAGLMAAATAGARGRRVLVIDHAERPGKKILMSGGGRCNFTNLESGPEHFLSDNPDFCRSALARYTPWEFLALVEGHEIPWVEKAAGQLFCRDSSRDIVTLLERENHAAGTTLWLKTAVEAIQRSDDGYHLKTSAGPVACESLIVATGGRSAPKMGATGFGYAVAEQFGLTVLPTRPALVPFTLDEGLRRQLSDLAGVSIPVEVAAGEAAFHEPMLITHRGLSGPAMLQVSGFWEPGEALAIDLLPGEDALALLHQWREDHPARPLDRLLATRFPRRFARGLAALHGWRGPLQGYANTDLERAAATLNDWRLVPAGTEGWRTAEVTLGGVDTRALSSRTLEVRDQPGLYFIGEVLDVTGQLGGHNFQWAWASGVAAGRHA